jgi:hypothetical protein
MRFVYLLEFLMAERDEPELELQARQTRRIRRLRSDDVLRTTYSSRRPLWSYRESGLNVNTLQVQEEV